MILIIAIAATITMSMLQEQIAIREIESAARRLITHAHFARQQALHHGESTVLKPLLDGKWGGGWVISSGCLGKSNKPNCVSKVWLTQGRIDPIFSRDSSRPFIDPHTDKVGILFNAAGAAKTAQGGFVANRLVLGHQRYPNLERQVILGSGGRWRICDPARDTKRCH